MVYHEDMDSYSHLSDRDMGILIRLLYRASLGECPEVPKRLLSEYNAMAKKVQKDAEAYSKRVEQATRASHARKQKTSDDIGRYLTISDEQESNYKHKHKLNRNNNALEYAQRTDDMSDVLIDL